MFYYFIYLKLDFCEGILVGVYVNFDDCYGFIMCDVVGIVYEMVCFVGFKFNLVVFVCDYLYNVDCEDGSG